MEMTSNILEVVLFWGSKVKGSITLHNNIWILLFLPTPTMSVSMGRIFESDSFSTMALYIYLLTYLLTSFPSTTAFFAFLGGDTSTITL